MTQIASETQLKFAETGTTITTPCTKLASNVSKLKLSNLKKKLQKNLISVYTFDDSGNEVPFRLPASSPKIQFKVRDECSHCYDDD